LPDSKCRIEVVNIWTGKCVGDNNIGCQDTIRKNEKTPTI